jgi:hypothetical protein
VQQVGAALVPIIDYIVPVKFFSQQRVPLILIYKLDVSPQDNTLVSFCLQYKVNESFTSTLFDVDIEVISCIDFSFICKPMSNSKT